MNFLWGGGRANFGGKVELEAGIIFDWKEFEL